MRGIGRAQNLSTALISSRRDRGPAVMLAAAGETREKSYDAGR
jgi:hypothetical protein